MKLRDLFKTLRAPEPLDVHLNPGVLCAPCSGRVEPMEDLPDPVFSSGMMGRAVGVWPQDGVVYAPMSGTLTVAMPHAVGISGEGVELLVHAGVDTVGLDGNGLDLRVKKDERVEAGDVLIVMDRDKIKRAGCSDVVMCVVTNSSEIEESGGSVEVTAEGSVEAGAPLVRVRR